MTETVKNAVQTTRSKGEGTRIRGFVRAVVVFGCAFGLKLSADQTAAIYGLTEAALQLAMVD